LNGDIGAQTDFRNKQALPHSPAWKAVALRLIGH
jgi:hypothetical protein